MLLFANLIPGIRLPAVGMIIPSKTAVEKLACPLSKHACEERFSKFNIVEHLIDHAKAAVLANNTQLIDEIKAVAETNELIKNLQKYCPTERFKMNVRKLEWYLNGKVKNPKEKPAASPSASKQAKPATSKELLILPQTLDAYVLLCTYLKGDWKEREKTRANLVRMVLRVLDGFDETFKDKNLFPTKLADVYTAILKERSSSRKDNTEYIPLSLEFTNMPKLLRKVMEYNLFRSARVRDLNKIKMYMSILPEEYVEKREELIRDEPNLLAYEFRWTLVVRWLMSDRIFDSRRDFMDAMGIRQRA